MKKLLIRIEYFERGLVAVASIYSVYYVLCLDVPLFSKYFAVLISSGLCFLYFRRLMDVSDMKDESYQFNLSSNSYFGIRLFWFKFVVFSSFFGFTCLLLFLVYEIVFIQRSNFFPLKSLLCLILYLIFKRNLVNLVKRL